MYSQSLLVFKNYQIKFSTFNIVYCKYFMYKNSITEGDKFSFDWRQTGEVKSHPKGPDDTRSLPSTLPPQLF